MPASSASRVVFPPHPPSAATGRERAATYFDEEHRALEEMIASDAPISELKKDERTTPPDLERERREGSRKKRRGKLCLGRQHIQRTWMQGVIAVIKKNNGAFKPNLTLYKKRDTERRGFVFLPHSVEDLSPFSATDTTGFSAVHRS